MFDTKSNRMFLFTTVAPLTAVFLSGCGTSDVNSSETSEEVPDYEKIEVTLINATGSTLGSVDFNDMEEGHEQTYLLPEDISNPIKNDSEYTITLRDSNDVYMIVPCDESFDYFYSENPEVHLEDGSIVVLPPLYDSSMEIVFTPGTDIEKAKETAHSSFESFIVANSIQGEENSKAEQSDAESGRQEHPESKPAVNAPNLNKKELQQSLEKLGYESLEDMRRQEHETIDTLNAAFEELEGYWYPAGDVESLSYFSVADGIVRRYFFDREQGDVLQECLSIRRSTGKTYTLEDGEKFQLKVNNILDKEELTIQFDGDDAEYYWRAY